MYIWIGCKLPEEFEKEIRAHCLALNAQIGLDTVAFLLPQHISLKISFQTDRETEILEELTRFACEQMPFKVQIRAVEQAGNILWLSVVENAHLRQLHDALDARLEHRFGVPQHAFDKCFLFHSTLFMDQDTKKLAQMYAMLEDYPVARELQVNTFLLGASETGRPGTYRIVREIPLVQA